MMASEVKILQLIVRVASRPATRAPRTAYSQAYPGLQLRVQFLHHSVRVVCRYGLVTI